jgi:hypothetical protein
MKDDKPFISPSSERAARRYESALRVGSSPHRSDGNTEEQAERFRAAAERADIRTLQLKQVLGDLGVPVSLHCIYRNFVLHVDKLIREYDHATLRHLVNHALARWTCRGCRPDVLQAICKRVFGLA